VVPEPALNGGVVGRSTGYVREYVVVSPCCPTRELTAPRRSHSDGVSWPWWASSASWRPLRRPAAVYRCSGTSSWTAQQRSGTPAL